MTTERYTDLLKEAMQLHDEIDLLHRLLTDRIERLSAIDDHFLTLRQDTTTGQGGGDAGKDG